MMIMPPDTAPSRPAGAGCPDPDDPPVLPDRSPADSDVAWGDPPDTDDDERLILDRPPHWDS
jgi:hypothetical protein